MTFCYSSKYVMLMHTSLSGFVTLNNYHAISQSACGLKASFTKFETEQAIVCNSLCVKLLEGKILFICIPYHSLTTAGCMWPWQIHLGPILPTWIKLNRRMDKLSHGQQSLGRNEFLIHKLQRLHRWRFKMDQLLYHLFCNGCNYSCRLG